MSAPLRDRFGIVSQLEYYSEDELTQIIDRTSRVYNIKMDEDAKRELARRSRGTPRIANRLFRRVRDFSQFYGDATITKERTTEALERLKVDNLGLDDVDHKYLLGIIHRFKGGPVGLEAIAASIGEEPQTLEDVNEPYLLQIGLIKRTPRGRIATAEAYRHLHISQEWITLEKIGLIVLFFISLIYSYVKPSDVVENIETKQQITIYVEGEYTKNSLFLINHKSRMF